MLANQQSNNGLSQNPQFKSKILQSYKQLINAEAEVIGYKALLSVQKDKSDQIEELSKKLKSELAVLNKKYTEVCQELQQLRQ
jgi:hypothetical protein